MDKDLKLCIELVPITAWNVNLRYLLHPKKWQEVRKVVLKKGNGKCHICNRERKSFDCHEIWEYNEIENLQTLVGIIPLCKTCHLCKHIGFATSLAMDDKMDFDAIIRHFCWVNGCCKEDFLRHYNEEMQKWEIRNTKQWKQDLSYIVNFGIDLF